MFLDNCHVCTQWPNGVTNYLGFKVNLPYFIVFRIRICYKMLAKLVLRLLGSLPEVRMSRFDSSLQKRAGGHLIDLNGAKLVLLQGGRLLVIYLQCNKLAV